MKTSFRSSLVLAGIIVLLTIGSACDSSDGGETETEDTFGTVSGVVRDDFSGDPLPYIPVKLSSFSTTTDQEGRFEILNVPTGSRTITISLTGFDDHTSRIDVASGANSVDISLVRKTYYAFDTANGNFGLHATPGVSTYRGVIVLGQPSNQDTRGFASGFSLASAPAGLNEFVAAERERSLLLANKYGLALMGVEGVGRGDPGTFLVLDALEQFAEDSGRPELAGAPVLFIGFSFGGCFAVDFAVHQSERAIGFMSHKGGCHSASDWTPARPVPGYFVIGSSDTESRAENITGVFEENRARGALWALAVEQQTDHTPVCDQDLLYNWMDVVLENRLPETVAPGAPVVLRGMNETSGWLGHRETFETAEYASYTEDKLQASWLPSQQTADDWRAFVSASTPEIDCKEFFNVP